ncbi:Cation efflux system protein CusF precursor [Cedecea lapagei]|uniref:Cation efflux system protein CusF n=1 Tax=Cedecea lapagei TaxID=158823 RepID=A0A3S4J4B7_9ENTR|nr:copper-binding protein [Cedecea lapagei]VEB99668.1 Cation efflux system protein CusF precursor [Cedecea lapagei]
MSNILRSAAACALLVAASFPAFSAETTHDMSSMKGMSDMPGMSMSSDASPSTTVYHTEGVVKKVTADTVTISHHPVAELGWPAMTMTFALPKDNSLPALTVGEKLAFSFTPHAAGYQLVSVTPLK